MTTRNKQHGLALLHSEQFHILLLCASVSGRTRREFVELFRSKNPGGKVIVNENVEEPTFEFDALVPGLVTPTELIDTVRKVLETIDRDK